jgi:hypothetical protein
MVSHVGIISSHFRLAKKKKKSSSRKDQGRDADQDVRIVAPRTDRIAIMEY